MNKKPKFGEIIETLIDHISLNDEEKRDKFILENKNSVIPIVKLLVESVLKEEAIPETSQTALNCLVAVSAAATSINTCKPLVDAFVGEERFIRFLVDVVVSDKESELHLGILVNLTRCAESCEDVYKLCPNNFISELFKRFAQNQLVSGFITNLTQIKTVREEIVNNQRAINSLFLTLNESNDSMIRNAAVCVIRNCCFDTDLHEKLLNPSLELLTKLVYPLAGPEEFDEEEMEKLPLDLQYLGEEKIREPDSEVRKLLVESVLLLCATRFGRETIRGQNVYFIFRELHKWEKVKMNQKMIEDLVDILIKKESEMEADNLQQVEIPDDLIEKFNQIDKQFLEEQ